MHVIISAIKFDDKSPIFGVIIFIQLGEIVGKACGGLDRVKGRTIRKVMEGVDKAKKIKKYCKRKSSEKKNRAASCGIRKKIDKLQKKF